MKKKNYIITALAAFGLLTSCSEPSKEAPAPAPADDQAKEEAEHEHEHEEIALGTFKIGGISVEALQGHGKIEAGKEGHLVIKLSYKDDGATVVRAWIGSQDRTLSSTGKGEYAPSHDDYDIHAVSPDPLPEGAKWWLEIEKPDGTKAVGSIPLLKDVKKG